MQREASIEKDPDLRSERIVRRYLDLGKFLDLLRSKALYLRRADGFSDRFEGALTPAIRRAIDEAHHLGHTPHDAEHFYRRARLGSFVSCWNLSGKDNMALWQLYGGVSNSVAVTSTVDNLIRAALNWNERVLFHKVRYIDHFKSPNMVIGRTTDPLQFKHLAYRYESEVRIIVPRLGGSWEKNRRASR